jgi:hypothetical protein
MNTLDFTSVLSCIRLSQHNQNYIETTIAETPACEEMLARVGRQIFDELAALAEDADEKVNNGRLHLGERVSERHNMLFPLETADGLL